MATTLVEKARKLGRAEAAVYRQEFGVDPARDADPDGMVEGVWECEAKVLMQDAGMTEAEHDACKAAFRAALLGD
jgi:hypothetical protein